VEILHLVRDRSTRLRSLVLGATLLLVASCEPLPDPQTQPDEVLQAELGLTPDDRVYRVMLTGGPTERADPVAISIEPGSYVEFVTTDWLIHEVIFEAESLAGEQWSFLERTDQIASPPLINRESRYVLSFEGAPLGRYPYSIEGNGGTGSGVIIVADPALAPPPRNP
jgi:plastocyanin